MKRISMAMMAGAFVMTGCASNDKVEKEVVFYKVPSHFGEHPARHGYSLQFLPYEKNGVVVLPSKNWIPGHGYDNIDLIRFSDKSDQSNNVPHSHSVISEPRVSTLAITAPSTETLTSESYQVTTSDEAPAECVNNGQPVIHYDNSPNISDISPKNTPKLTITFPISSSELSQEHRDELDTLDDTLNYLVIGYADAQGDACFNMTLSQTRAITVADYLKSRGINVVGTHGLGEILDGDEQSNPTNRRVDVTPQDGVVISVINTKVN